MSSTRLNIELLRERSLSRTDLDRQRERLLAAAGAPMSRRRLMGLGMAGATALGMTTSVGRALGGTAVGPLEIVEDAGRVTFRMGGVDRFIIDPAFFAGTPTLTVTRSSRNVTVELTNALLPGTLLPADVKVDVSSGLIGRIAVITMKLGGFRARVGLETWLSGAEPASSILNLAETVCELPGQGSLRLHGTVNGSFAPDWSLHLRGTRVVRTVGKGSVLTSDSVVVSPRFEGGPSMFATPPQRSTSLSFPRGEYPWPIVPSPSRTRWLFLSQGAPFDIAHVEAASDNAVALVLEGLGDQDRLWVSPSSKLRTSDGSSFAIPLARPRYGIVRRGKGFDTAIVAEYGRSASWLHLEQSSLLVGGGGDGTFELLTTRGRPTRIACSPPLRGTFLPLPDSTRLIVDPVEAEPGSRVHFGDSTHASTSSPHPSSLNADHGGGVDGQSGRTGNDDDALSSSMLADASTPSHATIQLSPRELDRSPLLVVKDPRLAVVRPDDLLVLTIVFKNMRLSSEGEKSQLVRDGGGAAYLIVHFPPQNIAEEALWEAEDSYTDPKPKDSDPPSGSSDNPASFPPPVQSRYSGPTRLVFTVPNTVSSIGYSLESILDAIRDFPLSVAPHGAEPGPEEPSPRGRIWKLADNGVIKQSGHLIVNGNVVVNTDKLRARQPVTRGQKGSTAVTSYRETVGHLIQAASLQRAMKSDVATMKKASEISAAKIAVTGAIAAAVKPKIEKPTDTQTAIESPFRLIVTPNRYGSWSHVLDPVVGLSGRIELWHTRLGVRNAPGINAEDPRYMTLRAIWSRDKKSFEKPGVDVQNPILNPLVHENEPFRMSLDWFDRWNIVHLTSNWRITIPTNRGSAVSYLPTPVSVNLLMLSSLGSWMDTRGAWENLPQGLSVEEWKHVGTMGRDHFVKVVYAGFLFPFGHRASLIKITERKIYYGASGPIAYMFQRMFIVVREHEKVFRNLGIKVTNLPPGKQTAGDGSADERSVDYQMPFRRVTITTGVTPNLDKPENSDILSRKQSCFWPQVGAKDFAFGIVAEDVDGKSVELTMPLAFIGKEITDVAEQRSVIVQLAKKYEKEEKANGSDPADPSTRRRRPGGGQKVVYAPYAKPGDTTFETIELAFGAEVPEPAVYNTLDWRKPRYYPVVRSTKLHVPSIKHLAGTEPQEFEFSSVFARVAFDGSANAGELLFDLVEGKELKMDFSKQGDRSGALATPNMSIKGLARALGPVGGDTSKIAGGNFDPTDFFSGLLSDISPKLFGVINIWDVVNGIAGGDLLNKLDVVPKFVTETLDQVEKFLALIEQMQATAERLKSVTDPNVALVPTADIKNKLQSVLDAALAIIGPDGDIANLFKEPFDPPTIDGKLGTLQTHIGTLSSSLGNLMSGLEAPAPGVAEGEIKFFRDALRDVQGVLGDINGFLDKVRQFIGIIPTELPKELTLKFEWKPELKDWGFEPGKPLFIASDNGKKATFVIGVEARVKTDLESPPKVSVYTSLENFAVDLIAPVSFIVLHFEKVQFIADTGLKADVNVVLRDLEFVGPLSFVETLKDLIPLDGFSDPPGIDVDASGIHASFSIPIPSVSVGVFSMKNITFSAGFDIPFIGDPLSVNFAFCTKENPFVLTVMMFGGGGFFGITLDPGGIQSFEAAFEFGASLSVDFGVASGGVEIMAGVYFKMTLTDGKESALLNGYLRLKGYVDVLGLISCTIEMKMELIYESASGKCIGRATIIIEVEVLCFSASVEVSAEKKFAGSNGDPTFREVMGPALIASPTPAEPDRTVEVYPWREYCQAFA